MQILDGELNIKASIKPNLAEISHKKRKITKRKILDNVINNLYFFICLRSAIVFIVSVTSLWVRLIQSLGRDRDNAVLYGVLAFTDL